MSKPRFLIISLIVDSLPLIVLVVSAIMRSASDQSWSHIISK